MSTGHKKKAVTGINLLNLYCERVEVLKATRLLRDGGLQAEWKIQFDQTQGSRTTFTMPDEDLLRSFLVTFRQFFMEKEPVYLNRAFNTLHRLLTDEEIKTKIVEGREKWRVHQRGQHFQITIDAVAMTPEHVMDLWINGYYFHNDEEHREAFHRMVPEDQQITKVVFIDFLVNATRFVTYIEHIIKHSLENHLLTDLDDPTNDTRDTSAPSEHNPRNTD